MNETDGFCGWYFKCQSNEESLALIPAVHRGSGRQSCSVQLICGNESLNFPLPYEGCEMRWDRPYAKLGENVFTPEGIRLHLQTQQASVSGSLRFGAPTPLRYDIMGPFRRVPFMECKHRIFSMRHAVNGDLQVNGKNYRFTNGLGYIEGDRGRSFPKRYAWTQCCFAEGSLMLAAADIPLGVLHFTGVIGAILLCGKAYRIATYLGARVLKLSDREMIVRQGPLTIKAALLDDRAQALKAPSGGAMVRTIRENILCHARYQIYRGKQRLLDLDTEKASFEYEY